MATPIQPFPAKSQKIYNGKSGCPRTVVIQLLASPAAGANVFVGPDKAELDQANDNGSGILTYGVGVADLLGAASDRLVLPDVETDIYARGNNWSAGSPNPAIIGVMSF